MDETGKLSLVPDRGGFGCFVLSLIASVAFVTLFYISPVMAGLAALAAVTFFAYVVFCRTWD